MRAAISYNVFNGEELLLDSLRQVRGSVQHINAVVQFVSYAGNPCSPDLRLVLAQACEEGLIDAVWEFVPDPGQHPRLNELAKRAIGLQIAKDDHATHFMTMDCDEFYVPEEFAAARHRIEQEGILASAVRSYLYIKRPIWRSFEPDTTYCSFLTAIGEDSRLTLDAPYPVAVDPKRRLHGESESFVVFEPEEIAMHHMAYVRRDIEDKLANSPNAGATAFIEAVADAYDAWEFGMPLTLPRKPPLEIVEVADLFGLGR